MVVDLLLLPYSRPSCGILWVCCPQTQMGTTKMEQGYGVTILARRPETPEAVVIACGNRLATLYIGEPFSRLVVQDLVQPSVD